MRFSFLEHELMKKQLYLNRRICYIYHLTKEVRQVIIDSIPGIPSLYLGNTSYACWLELGCPAEYKFNVSPVLLDGTQKILNLAVMTRRQFELDDYNLDHIHCWL